MSEKRLTRGVLGAQPCKRSICDEVYTNWSRYFKHIPLNGKSLFSLSLLKMTNQLIVVKFTGDNGQTIEGLSRADIMHVNDVCIFGYALINSRIE